MEENRNYCTHWECPYKYCMWHENYDEELQPPRFWNQETKNPMTCSYYLDV